jgi:hypothetical protein
MAAFSGRVHRPPKVQVWRARATALGATALHFFAIAAASGRFGGFSL